MSSGGFIKSQGQGAHTQVVFTLFGEIAQADADFWNEEIIKLKHRFKDHVVAITITAETTPPDLLRKQREFR